MTKVDPIPPSDNTLPLPDGRRLGYATYGRADGKPLFYFHGHPGARLEAKFLAEPALQAGVRLIGIDRPGLGRSTFQANRRYLDWPNDVAALADSLQIDRFAVIGFSGGGPYVLACAYKIPQRLTACGIVSGVGPLSPFLAFLSQWMPWLMMPVIQRSFQTEAQAQKTLERAAANWVEADRKSLETPGIKQLMAASLVEGLRSGAKGAAYEGALFGRSWGFKLEEINFSPIYLWHGELDKEVSIAMGQAVARRLTHCSPTYYPGEGHISLIVNQAQAILKALT
jgi:pimeloyl-ACP methyl ester carboxylesterase